MRDDSSSTPALKAVFVPWGADDYGDDVWLLENALVLCLESALDRVGPGCSFADLYAQLQGDRVRAGAVAPYSEAQLLDLAARAPADVNCLVDGQLRIRRDADTGALASADIALRVLSLPGRSISLPDAFVFDRFAVQPGGRDALRVREPDAFFALAAALAEAMLSPLRVAVSTDELRGELAIAQSWDAFCAFIRAKRQARTGAEKHALYEEALRAEPGFFWALFNDGQVFKSEREFVTARKRFLDAARCRAADAQVGEALFEAGLCSVALGDTKTARNLWDRALAYTPENPALLVNIAGTYEQEEDFARASDLHRAALAIDPSNYKALASLGRLEAAFGHLDSAIDLYERALALRPDDALRHAILGGCYLASGDEARAREHLDAASRLDPPRGRLAPVTGSDAPDDLPAPGEYARAELAKLGPGRSERG